LVPKRLTLALELGCATDVIVGGDNGRLAEAVAALEPDGVDFVVEATGAMSCIKLGWDALATGGGGRRLQIYEIA